MIINTWAKSQKNLQMRKSNMRILPCLPTYSITRYFPFFFSSFSYECYLNKQSISEFYKGAVTFSLIQN